MKNTVEKQQPGRSAATNGGSRYRSTSRRTKATKRSPESAAASLVNDGGNTPSGIHERLTPISAGAMARDRFIELYAPAGLIMTAAGETVEIFGDCNPFLVAKKDRADCKAFSAIKHPFRAKLRALAKRVRRAQQSAISSPVALTSKGKTQLFRMSVHTAGQTKADESCLLLVCFEEHHDRPAKVSKAAGAPAASTERTKSRDRGIVRNRGEARRGIGGLGTADERVRSPGEVVQASNEELAGAGEETITGRGELRARTPGPSAAGRDLRNILDSLVMGVLVVDRNLSVTCHNRAVLRFFDLPAGGKPDLRSVATRVPIPNLLDRLTTVIKTGESNQVDFRCGNDYFLAQMSPYVDEHLKGFAGGAVMTILDITDKKAAEERLRLSASVFEHASEATMITDVNNRILSVNPAFTAITGYTAEEAIGNDPRMFKSGKHSREFYRHMWDAVLATGIWRGEIQNRRKNGEIYTEWLSISTLRDEAGQVSRHVAVFSDISKAKKAQETIERQATYDSLTGLPNRALTLDRLNRMLAAGRRNHRMFAVMFMDIDHFKSVNDAMGHAAGDELLVKTAQRISGVLRNADSVGRMGGDEFIVLLDDINSDQDVAPIANKILAAVRRPMVIAGQTLHTATSIGVTLFPPDGDTVEAMLKNADSAMYEAKKQGRNNFCFFTKSMQDEANRRHWINSELGAAVAGNHLQGYYQPIIRLDTMSVAGAEALLRWQHPVKGFIPPEVFVPVAEQNGMIASLGAWVFEHSEKDWVRWSRENDRTLSLSFNMSVAQFVASGHMRHMLEMVGNSELARTQRLIVEVTESRRLSENQEYLHMLSRFRDYGCRIAIDDFGTGYSSLNYLKRMPVDIIKIDRAFVHDINVDPSDLAMIRAMLQMAKAFGIKTVAEGVESEAQLAFLVEHGCDYAQGFLFSKPVPMAEFAVFARQFSKPRT